MFPLSGAPASISRFHPLRMFFFPSPSSGGSLCPPHRRVPLFPFFSGVSSSHSFFGVFALPILFFWCFFIPLLFWCFLLPPLFGCFLFERDRLLPISTLASFFFRLRPISTSANFDFGQFDFDQFLDVEFLVHQGWDPIGWRPRGWRHRRVGGKISRFFSLLPLLSFSWGPYVEFWWCLKRRGPEMCTFGVLGLSCASPGAPVWWGCPGFTHVYISGSGLQKHQQNSTQGPQERERRMKIVAGGGKKRAKFWAVRRRVVRWRDVRRRVVRRRVVRRRVVGRRVVRWRGSSPEGRSSGRVHRKCCAGFLVLVQFRFLGTKTETEQKQNEERDE